jgi:drug/metabolite transporter (DMT)-like permease
MGGEIGLGIGAILGIAASFVVEVRWYRARRVRQWPYRTQVAIGLGLQAVTAIMFALLVGVGWLNNMHPWPQWLLEPVILVLAFGVALSAQAMGMVLFPAFALWVMDALNNRRDASGPRR